MHAHSSSSTGTGARACQGLVAGFLTHAPGKSVAATAGEALYHADLRTVGGTEARRGEPSAPDLADPWLWLRCTAHLWHGETNLLDLAM